MKSDILYEIWYHIIFLLLFYYYFIIILLLFYYYIMKLSRRRKSARRVRHTKRAGNKLRYKSKKFRALKRYHRRGGRHTKKLYGRRVKKGGEVKFYDPTSVGERSEIGYTYKLTGTIKSELRYKKIGSVMSDTSPFDIEITAVIKDSTTIKFLIKFTRKKTPIVTYTMTSDELILILDSISDPNIAVPQIMGDYIKTGLMAKYEFSFKDNVKDFTTIKDKVEEIQRLMGQGTIYYTGTKLHNEKREYEDNIEETIKKNKVLKINIAPLGQEDKEINYPTEILELQNRVDAFETSNKNNPNKSQDISRAKALMALIPDFLLGLLVGVYSNGPLKGPLNRPLNRPTTAKYIAQANQYTLLTAQLTSICPPVGAAPTPAPAHVDSAADDTIEQDAAPTPPPALVDSAADDGVNN